MTLLYAEPTEVLLELSSNLLDLGQYSGLSGSRPWRSLLNRSCLAAVLDWLQAEGFSQAQAIFPGNEELGLWELLDGSAIAIANTRIILIPSEAIDNEELRVPQEWIDIADWTGDYYLAAQVNPDEQWTRLWAWTTHTQLKTQGNYDPRDRTYSLNSEALYTDMSGFWVAQELGCTATKAQVAVLPPLEAIPAENLIERLGKPEMVFPRREVPFELWGALLRQSQWRARLFRKRAGQPKRSQPITSLRAWWENTAIAGWQRLENTPSTPALGMRDRSFSGTMIRRLKVMTLATTPPQTVALLMTVGATEDERLAVAIRLHPQPGRDIIPPGITLELLSLSGEPFKTISARDRDNAIQIPRFKCPPGFSFAVCVRLDGVEEVEYFHA
jgi:hypothetical protein